MKNYRVSALKTASYNEKYFTTEKEAHDEARLQSLNQDDLFLVHDLTVDPERFIGSYLKGGFSLGVSLP